MSGLFTVSNEEVLCVDRFIGDENCVILCSKFRQEEEGFENAKRLILRGNCLGSRGAQSISEMLKSNHSLQILSLEWNQLGSSGLSFLAIALEYNTHLLQIDLRNNGISDDGAVSLAESLLKNSSVQVVDLRWNQIGDEGAQTFENVFKKRKNQLSILLAGNILSMAMAGKVERWNNGLYRAQEDPKPEPPKKTAPPQIDFDLRNKELTKENDTLKREIMEISHRATDLQRQVDTSALRVTDLEQLTLRDQHRIRQLEESLGMAKGRIGELTNELAMAQDMWSKDRVEAMDEHKQEMQEMLMELTQCSQERDMLREKHRKAKEMVETLQVQMERTQRKAQEDVCALEEELRLSTQKCADLSVKETRAHGEAAAAIAALERMKERAVAAESELELTRSQTQADMEREQERCHEEVSRVRKQAAESTTEAAKKNMTLLAEILSLNEKLGELSSDNSTLQLEMKQSCEEAAARGRESERARAEEVIDNLKQRLEVSNTEKRNAEERYSELTAEMKHIRQDYVKQVDSIQSALKASREEERALQLLNKSIRDVSSGQEATLQANTRELIALRNKVSELEDKSDALQSNLTTVSSERDELRRCVSDKESELREMKTRMSDELRALSSRLTQTLAREIEEVYEDDEIF